MITKGFALLIGAFFSSYALACSNQYALEDIFSYDQKNLMRVFELSDVVSIATNLKLNAIGGGEPIILTSLDAKALKAKDGFYMEIPGGQYYLEVPNQLLKGNPICKHGMVSSGSTIYSIDNNSSLESIHSCGSAGCSYHFTYSLLPAVEMCKVLTQ